MFYSCRREYELGEKRDCVDLLAVLSRLDEAGPLTALGYFPVDKSTLSNIVGTILTYLHILVQYKE